MSGEVSGGYDKADCVLAELRGLIVGRCADVLTTLGGGRPELSLPYRVRELAAHI